MTWSTVYTVCTVYTVYIVLAQVHDRLPLLLPLLPPPWGAGGHQALPPPAIGHPGAALQQCTLVRESGTLQGHCTLVRESGTLQGHCTLVRGSETLMQVESLVLLVEDTAKIMLRVLSGRLAEEEVGVPPSNLCLQSCTFKLEPSNLNL